MKKKIRQMSIQYICGGLLLLVLVGLYWPGLSGGFFFDDHANILDAPSLKVNELTVNNLLDVWGSGIAGPWGRPISMLSFAVNYYFTGFNAFWFKFSNLLIHCLNSILVFLLGLLIVAARDNENNIWKLKKAALIFAVLWAFHPIQLTSVLYVVQRMTSLSATFLLMALLLHIWARRKGEIRKKELLCLMIAWGGAFPLSMLCKETGILFILYVAVYEAVLSPRQIVSIDRFSKSYLLLLGIGVVGVFLYQFFYYKTSLLATYEIRTFTLFERVLTESRVIWTYLKMIVFPTLSDFGLYHDDFSISKGFLSPVTTVISFVSFGGLFILVWLVRHKNRIFVFGVLWFFAGHALESTIFPLELMHEHRNYLPSFGIMIALGSILLSDFMIRSGYKLAFYALFFCFSIYLGLITYLRSDMYRDDFRRTQIETAYRMNSIRSNYEAGIVLLNIFEKYSNPAFAGLARKHFERIISIDPDYRLALVGILKLECSIDNSQIKEEYEKLLGGVSHGKWMLIDRVVMHAIAVMSNEGTLCLDRLQMDTLFRQALRNPTTSLEDRSAMVSDYALYLWLGQKDYLAAKNIMTDMVAENKNDILNRLNLLQLQRFLGDDAGVIYLISDLNSKELAHRDKSRLERILSELVDEGVLKERYFEN